MWGSQSGFAPELVILSDKMGIKKNKTHKYLEKSKLPKIIYEKKLDISWKVTLESFNILWEYETWGGV